MQHFTGVEVDGELIDPENFTAEEGLKITVLSEYLETLGLGSHTIRVVFDDGFIETGLAIAEAEKEPEPEYSFVKGSNVKWKEGDLEFIVRRSIDDEECFSHFTGIKVDGAAVDVLNYTAKQGSTVITVKEDYLKTLEAGTHEITAEFDDGNVTAAFTVEAEEPEPTPPTGDRANPLLWGGILVVCVLAAAALWITRRKKKDES